MHKMSILPNFPDNLAILHKNEETLRTEALKFIAKSDDYKLHVNVIERAVNLIQIFIQELKATDDGMLIIQLLGIRISNAGTSALRLLLNGYFQNAALLMRDILETAFLMDWMRTSPEQREIWKTCSEDDRYKKFNPKKVRDALDARDGFKEGKRAAAYKFLSRLACHPTYIGFQMLIPEKGTTDAHPGPFLSEEALRASLEELSRLMLQAGEIWAGCFSKGNEETKYAWSSFNELKLKWLSIAFPSNAALENKQQQ